VDTQVLVEVLRVVKGDALEALDVCGQLVKLRETTSTLLLDTDLDFADPATLQFNTLGDDFLL
jgi:hypothetical protein